jgi:hypothetical protein
LSFRITFEIRLPNNQNNFNHNDLISSFNSIDSLFRSETEIILNENNFQVFEYLSNFLDKRSLSKTCKNVSSIIYPVFKFSSKHLTSLYENDLKKLNDFRLIVNGRIFNINFSLFCCVSDKFQSMDKQEEEFSFSIPNQCLPCLISFLDIFKGLPFYFEN